jgi:beta-phosphoglucomutase-like phosphatase (HAD superfamily)
MKKAARGRLFYESDGPITWRRWRERQRQVRKRQRLRQQRKQRRRQRQQRVLQQEPQREREREQRREPVPEQAPLLPSCRKRPGLRLQSGSPTGAISSFQVSFYG